MYVFWPLLYCILVIGLCMRWVLVIINDYINVFIDKDLVWIATNYIWALIPNFYLYAFYQTTTNYLQSQKVIYPPIVISICGTCLHIIVSYFFVYHLNMGFVGAAWSKNLADVLCCLAIYLYIIYK